MRKSHKTEGFSFDGEAEFRFENRFAGIEGDVEP